MTPQGNTQLAMASKWPGLGKQGRIKVRGGPRLDTVMGPYHFHLLLSYHRLRKLSFGVSPLESFKLQMPVGELSFRAFLPNYMSNLCQDELAVFTRTTSNRLSNEPQRRKRSSSKTQGSSRHDACRQCLHFCKFFERIT